MTGLNDAVYVVMKSFERLVMAHLKDITGHFLDPLHFAYQANLGLMQGSCLWMMLKVDSTFNIIIPFTLLNKLDTALCTHQSVDH